MPVGQTVIGREIGEAIAVEPRDSIAGAEPQESVEVLLDLINGVSQQAVGGRISFYGKALGKRRQGCRDEKEDSERNPPK